MFRYKHAKHKSNYLRVTVPAGADCVCQGANGEEITMHQGECTLVIPLFGGTRTVSARYDAGRINGRRLIGETTLSYAYEPGKLRVCAYDYVHHGLWEQQPHDSPPGFRLLCAPAETDGIDGEEKPLLTVSSSRSSNTVCAMGDALAAQAPKIQERLRGIYDRIEQALKGTGVFLSIHQEDILEKDDSGNIVGAAFVRRINYTGYFYNVDGSTYDNFPPGFGDSWLEVYDRCLASTNPPNPPAPGTPIPEHRYCSSQGFSTLTCNLSTDYHPYVGGHILTSAQLQNANHTTGSNGWLISGLSREEHRIPENGDRRRYQPVYDQTFVYYLVPICRNHNFFMNYNIVMYTQLHGAETIVELNCFRSDCRRR